MFLFLLCLSFAHIHCDYYAERDNFIETEKKQFLGSNINLTSKEEKVNAILMDIKLKEYDDGFQNPKSFLPAIHFFHAKDRIEQSQVFKFIQKLPKGGSLHLHNTAMASDEVLYNVTYSDNLYACKIKNKLKLHFFDKPDKTCTWKLLSDLRKSDSEFDNYLKSQLSLITEDPKRKYNDINEVWSLFIEKFTTASTMIRFKPIYLDYFYKALQELYDDNVMYVELRCTLSPVYDLYKEYDALHTVALLKNVTEEFVRDHPRFIGAKIIYSPVRHIDYKTIEEYLKISKELIRKFPDFVVGFDLVGQEDLGFPLISFIKQLRNVKNDVKFYFHAGETNWYGTSSDHNLIDAVLLGTERIGHGYSLIKHPDILKLVKEREIAIEINPICNQVLLLVDDLRNHPGAMLISQGYPIVIGNDATAFWGAKGLSHDWYMAYMGMASRSADLKFLKQLALNSFKYSALDIKSKIDAIFRWNNDWDDFIEQMLKVSKNYLSTNDICPINY